MKQPAAQLSQVTRAATPESSFSGTVTPAQTPSPLLSTIFTCAVTIAPTEIMPVDTITMTPTARPSPSASLTPTGINQTTLTPVPVIAGMGVLDVVVPGSCGVLGYDIIYADVVLGSGQAGASKAVTVSVYDILLKTTFGTPPLKKVTLQVHQAIEGREIGLTNPLFTYRLYSTVEYWLLPGTYTLVFSGPFVNYKIQNVVAQAGQETIVTLPDPP